MASHSKDFLNIPDYRYGISRANSLGRKEPSSEKRRSPSPAAAGYCTYSRLSAMRENGIFRKYIESTQGKDNNNDVNSKPSTNLDRTSEVGSPRTTSIKIPERSLSVGRRNCPTPDRAHSAELRPPRRTIVSTKQDDKYGIETKARSCRVPVRSSSATRASSSNRESRNSDGRRESYQTIRISLEQFANKHSSDKEDTSLSSGQSKDSESANGQNKNSVGETNTIETVGKAKNEPISTISRVSKRTSEAEATHSAGRVTRSNIQRQRSSSGIRESGRQSYRPVTPSFDEFKKRVRFPTFDEFRKREDENQKEVVDIESNRQSRATTVVNNSPVPIQKSISSLSMKNKDGVSNLTTRRTSLPPNSRSKLSEKKSERNQNISLTKGSRPNRSSNDSNVYLSKGLRLKPSYIPDQGEYNQDELTAACHRDNTPLDNSLDDNILVSNYLDDVISSKGNNSFKDHGEFKIEPNSAATAAKGAKRMDEEGNFWIVLREEATDLNETEHSNNHESDDDKERSHLRNISAPQSRDVDSADLLEHAETDMSNIILRSTSDVSDLAVSTGRKRKERKERPHKSDPFSRSERMRHRQQLLKEGSLFHGLSYNSINSVSSCSSMRSLNELTDEAADECDTGANRRGQRRSNLSTCSEDSGVIGQDKTPNSKNTNERVCDVKDNGETDTGKSASTGSSTLDINQVDNIANSGEQRTNVLCQECGKSIDLTETTTTTITQILSCRRCEKKKTERFRTLQEIVETEATYRRDLKILKEEFYLPIKSAGLLSPDQLAQIFLNIDELLQVNYDFLQQLKVLIGSSVAEAGNNLEVGELFLKASCQFLAFKSYCINQSSAAALLEHFERENELLKVFLQVSQSENTRLRKMNLKSFLVIPIQRITKYPLLLSRLYKATPISHHGRTAIKEAMERIEDILDHINEKTQSSGQGSLRSKRRKPESKCCSMLERFELIKVAQEQVSWERADISDVLVGKLHLATPADHTWAIKKGKTLKFTQVYGVVLTQGKPSRKSTDMESLCFPKPTPVKQALLCLLREKNEEFHLIREPLSLDRCVVSVDPDYPEVFEVQEWNKDSYILKADQPEETQHWVQHLKQRWIDLSPWRRRRNALANIMIKQTG